MELLLTELLIILVLIFVVALPLISKRAIEKPTQAQPNKALSTLLYRKDAAYIAIKDLDFDFSTGKLDVMDYHKMKLSLEEEALTILKKIESIKKGE